MTGQACGALHSIRFASAVAIFQRITSGGHQLLQQPGTSGTSCLPCPFYADQMAVVRDLFKNTEHPAVGLLVGGMPGQLLSNDAAERPERPMAIGLECACQSRVSGTRRVGSGGRGGVLSGLGGVACWTSLVDGVPACGDPIRQPQQRRYADYGRRRRRSTTRSFRCSLFVSSGRRSTRTWRRSRTAGT